MAVPNISEFKAKLRYGGARPSLFLVKITNPAVGGIDTDFSFMCNAASMPSWDITKIPVPYQGRTINVAGSRTFNDWTIQVYNDEDFKIRNALETWSNSINSLEGNVRTFASSEQSLYKSVAEVTQLSQTGKELRTYKITGIFPINVGEISLSWAEDGQIQNYPVTFAMDYFYVDKSTTGNAGGR